MVEVNDQDLQAIFRFLAASHQLLSDLGPIDANEAVAGLWVFLEKEISPELLSEIVEQAPVYRKVFAGLGLKASGNEQPAMETAREWIGASLKPDWPPTRRN